MRHSPVSQVTKRLFCGDVKLLAQRVEGLHANECGRAGLDDGATRCTRSEVGWGWDSRQFSSLFAADCAYANEESHRCRFVQDQDSTVCAQDVSTYKEEKREFLHHKQRMVYRDSSDLNRRIYIPADF